jgi:hypothetical protein
MTRIDPQPAGGRHGGDGYGGIGLAPRSVERVRSGGIASQHRDALRIRVNDRSCCGSPGGGSDRTIASSQTITLGIGLRRPRMRGRPLFSSSRRNWHSPIALDYAHELPQRHAVQEQRQRRQKHSDHLGGIGEAVRHLKPADNAASQIENSKHVPHNAGDTPTANARPAPDR